METAIIVALITSGVTAITSLIALILPIFKDNFKQKSDIRNDRLEKFYYPFYKEYCYTGKFQFFNFHDTDIDARKNLLKLMIDNVQYMGTESQTLLHKLVLYEAFSEMKNSSATDFSNGELDKNFNLLCNAILKEYVVLLKQGKHPVPKV